MQNLIISAILLLTLSRAQSTCRAGCSVCSSNAQVCYLCKLSSDQRVTNGACQVGTTQIPFCTTYNVNGTCSECSLTYYLVDGKCIKDGLGCLTHNSSGCSLCGFGTVLFNGQCRGILNCLNYSSLGNNTYSCSKCAEGFINSFGLTCYVTTNCQRVMSNGGCVQCTDGFYLSGYSCINVTIKLDGCSIFGVDGKCVYCLEGYVLKNGLCSLHGDSVVNREIVNNTNSTSKQPPILPTVLLTPRIPSNSPTLPSPVLTPSPTVLNTTVVALNSTQTALSTSNVTVTSNTSQVTLSTTPTAPLKPKVTPTPPTNVTVIQTTTTVSSTQAVVPTLTPPSSIPALKPAPTPAQTANPSTQTPVTTTTVVPASPLPTTPKPIPAQPSKPTTPIKSKPTFVPVAPPKNCVMPDELGMKCLVCDSSTFLDKDQSCRSIPSNCQQFDMQLTKCLGCVSNYSLNQGVCVAVANADANCRAYTDNKCVQCNDRYYLNGTCIKVNDLCLQADLNGSCLVCTKAYLLSSNRDCMEPNCENSSNYKCQSCKKGYVLDNANNNCRKVVIEGCETTEGDRCIQCQQQLIVYGGQCLLFVTGCLDYSLATKQCQLCRPELELQNGTSCVPKNCRNWTNSICNQCKNGYYVVQSACEVIPVRHCQIYTLDRCSACQDGYLLNAGACVEPVAPMNCVSFVNGTCLACQVSYTLVSGYCQPPPIPAPMTLFPNKCVAYDANGSCVSCLAGYTIVNGECKKTVVDSIFDKLVLSNYQTDPNCQIYSLSGTCLQCSSHYYVKDTRCAEVNPLCLTFNSLNGQCLSCYPDYKLSQGSCVKLQPMICATFDASNSFCLSCYAGYQLTTENTCIQINNPNCRILTLSGCQECSNGYFIKNNQCYPISSLCATSSKLTGDCITCYQGYQLANGSCIIRQQSPNCSRYDNNVCVECSQSYYRTPQGLCLPRNPQCKTVDAQDGSICTSCYPGYELQNSNCILPRNDDKHCDLRAGLLCLHCRNGYWLNNGICTQVRSNCRTYEQATGACLSCNSDQLFLNGECLSFPNPNDRNCIQVDSQNNCIACVDGYYVKDGQCRAVSILCLQFDNTIGSCTQCRPGYFLQEGDCIYPAMGYDPFCVHYRSSYCQKCQAGYYLSSWVCFKVDSDCIDFDALNVTCRNCRTGTPNGPICAP